MGSSRISTLTNCVKMNELRKWYSGNMRIFGFWIIRRTSDYVYQGKKRKWKWFILTIISEPAGKTPMFLRNFISFNIGNSTKMWDLVCNESSWEYSKAAAKSSLKEMKLFFLGPVASKFGLRCNKFSFSLVVNWC